MTILPASPPPSVILLGGASGSGKSYLARQHGRPHLSLDAFYRPQSDDGAAGGPGPVFPRTPYGEIDWDHPGTWDEQAAVDAVVELLEEGATRVPDYDISTSSVRGHS
ncbi:MAG: uridine kinase, partial [Micrococcus luteus]